MDTIEAVILANGDYPTAPQPLQLLRQAPYICCCDGGANEYIARGHMPHIIIGDGDSLCPAYRERYAALIHHNPDQETNDQTKAVQYLHALGMHRIAIVGATGKREDHTIGNLSLLIEYMRMGDGGAQLHRLWDIRPLSGYSGFRLPSRPAGVYL